MTAATTYHVDNQSTGFNGTEILLTPASVNSNLFGKKFSTTVDGQVYAEPLYVPNVNITTGPSQGLRNVVFVATQHDSLYAIDSASGNILWQTSFLNIANPAINLMNATAITTVPQGEVGSADISVEIGIIGTPVIDASTNMLYLVAKTKETIAGVAANYVQKLFKINIQDGSVAGSKVIADTISSGGNYTYVTTGAAADTPYVLGTGLGGNGSGRIYFNGLRQMVRPGLTLDHGNIYIASASHGDQQPYHGWVLSYDAATLNIQGALNTTPNGSEGGIWQGAGSMTFDPQGNMYFITGNGSFNQNANNFGPGFTGLPKDANYGDCFLKVSIDGVVTTQAGVNTTLNPNGWGLRVADFFSPYANAHNGDQDLGSGATMLLPDGVGSAAHPHLIVGGGKGGVLYLIDRDNMGGFQGGATPTDRMVQEIAGAFDGRGLFSAPAFYFNNPSPANGFPSGYIEVVSSGGAIKQYTISNGVITTPATSSTSITFGGLSGSPTISANGINNAILWSINRSGSALYAFDANNLQTMLWNSTQTGPNNLNNSMGSNTKFSVPTVADGLVFVGTQNSLVVYGLLAPPSGPPSAPTNISAIAPAFNSVVASWVDNANNEDTFYIERTTTPANANSWAQVGSVGSNTTQFVDTTVLATTTYYYRVRSYNSYNGGSYSAYATMVSGVTTPAAPPQGAGDGAYGQYYTGNPAGVPAFPFTGTLAFSRVDPTIDFNWATASPGAGVGVNNWGAVWTGRILAPTSEQFTFSANVNDGVNFYIWPVGTTKPGTALISRWQNSGAATITGTYTLSAGQYYNFEMDFFEDTNNALAHLSWSSTSIPLQVIPTSQLYSGSAPSTPTNLVLTPQASYQVNLAWNDTSNIETGYEVQRQDPDGVFETIATLPANSNAYIDTELFADVAYTYRVRALNFNQNSGFSNTAQVLTPIAPAAPTNGHMTSTTYNPLSISMAWTDVSIHENGYRIQRAPPLFPGQDEYQYADIAFLPPNTTTYTDNGSAIPLAAGTQYFYHIIAYNLGGSEGGADFVTETITDAPTNVIATPDGNNVHVSWTAPFFNSNDPDNLTYTLFRSPNASGTNADPVVSGITETSFIDTVFDGTYYYFVRATDLGGTSASSALTQAVVGSTPPSVAQPAQIAANPVTGTSGALSVLGTDPNFGAGTLKYTWSVLTKPAGAPDPTFTVNGTNAAKNTTANFTYSGAYTLRATIANPNNYSVTSDVTFDVTFGFAGVTGGTSHFTYGNNVYTLVVDSGSVVLASDLSAGGRTVNLDIAAGATLTANSTQKLSAITINAGSTFNVPAATPHHVITAASLSISATGALDLFNNDMIIDYGTNAAPIGTIETYLMNGRNNGTWNGNGIRSTTVAANTGLYAINALNNIESATPFDTFDGVNTASHKQVLIRYTYIDDIDLDGKIHTNDAISFATFYSEGQPGNHYHGDLNYDGVVNANDAIMFATAYNESNPQIQDIGGLEAAPLAIKQQASAAAAPAPAKWSSTATNVTFTDNTSPTSAFISVSSSATGGVTVSWRYKDGKQVASTHLKNVKGPVVLKITRVRNTFTAFYSVDGKHWKKIGISHTLNLVSPLANTSVTSLT